MNRVTAYSLSPTGVLWVLLEGGGRRPATKAEWLTIWRDHPFLVAPLPC